MAEPFFTDIPSSIQMTEAFNWYGENKSWADSKKYIQKYLSEHNKDELEQKVKKMSEHQISWVCGWICRLISQGSKVDASSNKYLNEWLEGL